jgi:hypothetical protein
MGFGHRVCRAEDPRGLQQRRGRAAERLGVDPAHPAGRGLDCHPAVACPWVGVDRLHGGQIAVDETAPLHHDAQYCWDCLAEDETQEQSPRRGWQYSERPTLTAPLSARRRRTTSVI